MKLPEASLCNNDPLLKSFYEDDRVGFLSESKGKNKYFLTRQRLQSAVELLKTKLPDSNSKNILVADIACGTGNAGLMLEENGFNVEFVDNEERFFQYIKMKKDSPKISFLLENVNNLSVEEKFDGIVFGEAIEHMANPADTLAKLHASLKRGGFLVVTTPNGNYKDCQEPSWSEVKSNPERNNKLANTIGNHVCEFKPAELRELVKESGFLVYEHFLVNSWQISRRSLLRRILPINILRKLDLKWAKRTTQDGKDYGRIQILLAQRAH